MNRRIYPIDRYASYIYRTGAPPLFPKLFSGQTTTAGAPLEIDAYVARALPTIFTHLFERGDSPLHLRPGSVEPLLFPNHTISKHYSRPGIRIRE